MKLLFSQEALSSYNELKVLHPEQAEKILAVIKSILIYPNQGDGSPTPLDKKQDGLWVHSFDESHKIVYSFTNNELKIHSIVYPLSLKRDKTKIQQTKYSEEEYQSVLAQMEGNRGKGHTPKVGIFWYSKGRDELFGVVSHPVSDYSKANASDGRITCSELHEDIWKKEYYRQRYKQNGHGLFIGQYQDKPRGRIFYNINEDTFEVACGKWLQEVPHVYEMILKEFDLPPKRTTAKYAVHWDIGQSWR